MAPKSLPAFSRAEVAKHNSASDAWIIVDDKVLDITKFAALHPGGEQLLLGTAGTDQTKDFWGLHRADVLRKYEARLQVGVVEGAKSVSTPNPADFSKVPYAEPSHLRGFRSPYYTEKHVSFRKAMRELIEKEVRPWCDEAETTQVYPSKEFFMKLGELGLIAAMMGPGEHLKLVPRLPGSIAPADFDYWCEGIVHEELGRIICPGARDSLGAGIVISLPVLINFGTKDKSVAQRVVREVLMGEKRICLAVTEPFVGSDVANCRLTATKSADGSYYLLNGVKKWITQGCSSDYFVTLARTGGPGAGGLTYFLVERGEGLETKQITTAYSKSAGTSYVVYENVKVPVSHMIGNGKEGQGFVQAMVNFTHERWMILANLAGIQRAVIEECFKWAMQREVFGKPLIQQPVIQFKLAEMVARVEAWVAWYENSTYQMTQMKFKEQGEKLSGTMALLKFEATRVGSLLADQAPQIFGGRAITQTGMGRLVERYARTYKFASILGGSEDVLATQGIKMALREFPGGAKL